ncbi:MAG: radical SAM protein [Salinivirgaceae bacterium]
MKILMVRPKPSPETIGLQHLMIVEPLELEILCTLKRDSDTVTVVDMILEKRSFESFVVEHCPDVICVTGYITNVSTIIAYCEAAKRVSDKITTIVGGVHCEVCPEDFEHCAIDFRVVRNAAIVFTDLLNHIDKKTALPKGVFGKGDSLENTSLPEFDFRVPFPDRSAVARYRNQYFYIFHNKVALVKTSFGCPYQCSFCFCRIITGGTYHRRPLHEVIQELGQIQEAEIYIVDDDFLVDKKWLQTFISEIKQQKIDKHYLVYGRADFIAENPDTIHELAQVGLRTVIVGFESFSDKELDAYNKNTSVAIYQKTMEVLHSAKIEVFATIIIPPHWDKKDFKNMVKVIKSLEIHFVNLQPLTPLPKTGVSFPAGQLIINRQNYPQWDLAHISVQPTKLTVTEFYKEILRAYHSILYNPKVLWKYFTAYKTGMLFKMLVGGYRVSKQYQKKIKEAENYA